MTGARRARGKGAGEAPKTFVSWVAEPSSSFARHRGTAGEGAVWGRGSLGCGPHNCCCWKPGGGWGAGLGSGAGSWGRGWVRPERRGLERARSREDERGLSVAPGARSPAPGGLLSTYRAHLPSHSRPFTGCKSPRSSPPSSSFGRALPPLTSGNQRGLHRVVGSSQMLGPRPADPGSEEGKGRVGEEDLGEPRAWVRWALAAPPACCSGPPGLRPGSPTAGKGSH